jgi:hypothetical protein
MPLKIKLFNTNPLYIYGKISILDTNFMPKKVKNSLELTKFYQDAQHG